MNIKENIRQLLEKKRNDELLKKQQLDLVITSENSVREAAVRENQRLQQERDTRLHTLAASTPLPQLMEEARAELHGKIDIAYSSGSQYAWDPTIEYILYTLKWDMKRDWGEYHVKSYKYINVGLNIHGEVSFGLGESDAILVPRNGWTAHPDILGDALIATLYTPHQA